MKPVSCIIHPMEHDMHTVRHTAGRTKCNLSNKTKDNTQHLPYLWSVEDGIVDGQHGCDGEYLLATAVPGEWREGSHKQQLVHAQSRVCVQVDSLF